MKPCKVRGLKFLRKVHVCSLFSLICMHNIDILIHLPSARVHTHTHTYICRGKAREGPGGLCPPGILKISTNSGQKKMIMINNPKIYKKLISWAPLRFCGK